MKKIVLGLFIITAACSQKKEEQIVVEVENVSYYGEQHRLQFHFSPEAHWMNDPNGMVYYEGEYHLFYQYYPDSTVWGPMHWGHAVSTDMVSWEHLPVALYPDDLGYIFSGSVVVDKNNTSGLGTAENPPLIAIYTYHHPEMAEQGKIDYQYQGIAYSTDKGRTWAKYENNPVLPNPGIKDFRDPKVFWYEEGQKWVMSLAVLDHITFYSSPDLKSWTKESDFGFELGGHGGVWECPDLIKMGDKWVLLVSINPGGPNGGSATQYFVGDFDGKSFTPQDEETRWIDMGRDNYAGVTWSNVPEEDGRVLFLGWMSNWNYAQVVPTEKWRSAMTVARTFELKTMEGKHILASYPVKELEQLRGESMTVNASGTTVDLMKGGYQLADMNLTVISEGEALGQFELLLFNNDADTLRFGYSEESQSFYINRDAAGNNEFSEEFNGDQLAPFDLNSKEMSLRVLMDVGSVEIFVNGGELVMTSLYFPSSPFTNAQLVTKNPQPIKAEGTIYKLKGIWNR
ncbi:glycoside hydrolase family 32 protein [Fulvivirga lutimaris]|uniref:glycoside hydrolase family 32 protein n=1 Tax=Fulvivirga lutimaris TaxID=1819566 RepID=UPI0012BD30A9|nr:glycoside hydrolase family 32 protein [Fulvivirga lutimaris]MTI40324.1 glycoside hydrolase family 32 protein [Fulvivirga lutimaris]